MCKINVCQWFTHFRQYHPYPWRSLIKMLVNDPLIVLDGVPLEKRWYQRKTNGKLPKPHQTQSEYRKAMTIIKKNASSTAIYGSRASNGVIIITTKKGNSDKIKVSFQYHQLHTNTHKNGRYVVTQ